jgi:hypothetical protein
MVRRNAVKRRFSGSVSTLDTGLPQSPYQYSLNAPLKKEQADENRPAKQGCGIKI